MKKRNVNNELRWDVKVINSKKIFQECNSSIVLFKSTLYRHSIAQSFCILCWNIKLCIINRFNTDSWSSGCGSKRYNILVLHISSIQLSFYCLFKSTLYKQHFRCLEFLHPLLEHWGIHYQPIWYWILVQRLWE